MNWEIEKNFQNFSFFSLSLISLFRDKSKGRGRGEDIRKKSVKNIQESLYKTTFVFYTIRLRRTHTHTHTYTRNFIVSSYVPSSITSQLSKRFQESLSNSALPKTSLNLDPFLESCYSNCQPSNSRNQKRRGEKKEIPRKKNNNKDQRSWTRINVFLFNI